MSSKDYIYCYQGSALRVGSGNVVVGKVFDPYDPSTVPPNTIRCKFSSGYTPTMGNAQTLIVGSENIWDIYKNSTDWTMLFANNNDLVEVLGANTSSCTVMSSMFINCTSLTTVPLFDTSSCTNMTDMFRKCSSLTTVPLFDTSSCTYMGEMFQYCYSLTTVPLFDTSSCTDMTRMFQYCSSLTTVPLFDTSSCMNMSSMFQNCTNVQSGAIVLYQQASTQATPPSNHSSCFYRCGSNTVTGAAELAQIPTSWGGTMAE
jgi:surface protein